MLDFSEFKEKAGEDRELAERYVLAQDRIKEIAEGEEILPEPYRSYFKEEAQILIRSAYEDMKEEHYGHSYANPVYAVSLFGLDMGRLFGFLAYELFQVICFEAEGRAEDVTILYEVFLEIYGVFACEAEDGKIPEPAVIKGILYSFVSDYLDLTVRRRIREQVDPSYDFAKKIIMEADLRDLSYLDRFGEYVTDDTRKLAEFLNSLPEEEILRMAETFTEGFRLGFINTGKDLSKKKTVNIRFCLGFERLVRAEIEGFRQLGLDVTIFRKACHAATRDGLNRVGYYGELVNEQMDYDHREDIALFLDEAYAEHKLEVMREAYEEVKQKASEFAGPAVMERFGMKDFLPVNHEEAIALTDQQRKLFVSLKSREAAIVGEYIRWEERSFTIISYPVPAIGETFEDIFRETVRLNTLPYKRYQEMQQEIIRVLERGDRVEVKGGKGNCTDLTVELLKRTDPAKETVFENCVADVNIPVGEVFTSPVLKGTHGLLHVSSVYLEGLVFKDLRITFEDGFIKEYSCANFESEEENRRYIEENILHHHQTIPMGEFAIGTNTTAYCMAKKYDIFGKLPILIAEKTGPHFAVGDTCYSRAEDIRVYNPDGREIISRDNEYTKKYRRTDPNKAYFECHTDITLPYEELKEISSIDEKGERHPIILDGRFVVPGAEELNKPLDMNGFSM